MAKDGKVIMQEQLLKAVLTVLEDKKAQDVVSLDVRDLTTMADAMVIASGTSHTQLRAMMSAVIMELKKLGVAPLGVEGEQNGEWILVDLGSILVHLMLPKIRQYYELEKLWSIRPG